MSYPYVQVNVPDRIKFTEEYFVNPIKRVVVCKLLVDNGCTCFSDVIEYIGKAKCAPDDEFNDLIGKRLASRRARAKFYNDISKSFTAVADYLADEVIRWNQKADKNFDVLKDIEDSLEAN